MTSWNWVLLTDFASFKPTHLPEDNPADFSYFFDTSRRRTCYIAPERWVFSIAYVLLLFSCLTVSECRMNININHFLRFVKTLGSDSGSQLLLAEENMKKEDLTPAMDIFSAGFVIFLFYLTQYK